MAKKQETETAVILVPKQGAPSEESIEWANEVVKNHKEQQTPLQPYDRVCLTFDDGRTEHCFWVGDGTYSKANSAGNAFKVGSERAGVAKVEKV